jgi:hypothetical protein
MLLNEAPFLMSRNGSIYLIIWNQMETDKLPENSSGKGGGIGPVVIISIALIIFIAGLKVLLDKIL